MVPQSKIDQVTELTAKLEQAKAVVLTDYTGLNVKQISDLRRQVKAVGGELEVAKNTLLKKALDTAKIIVAAPILTQPTAILWAKQDEVSPLKVLAEFIKVNNLPKIKAGLLEKVFISAEKVDQLANLPTREQLLAQLMSLLQAPVTSMARVLNGNLLNLINVLHVSCNVSHSKEVTK